MDLIAFAWENNVLPSVSLLLVTVSLLALVKRARNLLSDRRKLPPGPRPWPVIGNIHQVGNKPHETTARLSEAHGPLVSLRLGTQLMIVASSPEAAMEILRTHDRALSSRFVPNAFHHSFLPFSLIWSWDCNDNWKSLRALCRSELFSAKALDSQTSLRAEKLNQMIGFLESKDGVAVDVGEVVFTTISNTLSNLFFARDFFDLGDEHGNAGGLKEMLFKILEFGITPNVADFFPMLSSLDPQRLRKNSLKHMKWVFAKWEVMIKERREGKGTTVSSEKHAFLDKLLELGFSNDQINLLALELFTAGTDTTTSTIEWAMAELLKNEAAMKRVKEELSRELDSDSIKESQTSQLPYLNACIKETLRLHPPAPFLLPHRALETCQVMGYTIPKDAQILVNVWAIGRDPNVWADPLSFRPERFLGLNIDYKGQDFGYLPFGAGRRMCPGMPSAARQVPHILASLIRKFDWVLPDGQDPATLDMNDKFGVTLQKEKPLKIILKRR